MNGNAVNLVAEQSQASDLETEKTLHLLSDIEQGAVVSQQSLSLRLGIAVGLTNAYVKRAVRRGWIRMQKVPARRYAYYLTPKGLSEKSRLAVEYLSSSFGFFRRARSQCLDCLREAERNGWKRVAFVGASELAEIASLAAREADIELVGVIAPGSNQQTFVGLNVYPDSDLLRSVDAALITDIASPQKSYEIACTVLRAERVLTPSLLHVSRQGKSNGKG